MDNKAYRFYTEMPQWAKGVTIVFVLGTIGFLGYRVYRGIKNKQAQKDAEQTLKQTKQDIASLVKSGMTPSYSDSQYRIWADAAQSCYDGWGTCTGDTIFINMKNDLDVLKLIDAFGIRTIKSGAFNPTPDFTGDLPAVMRDELNAAQIANANKVFEKAGIKYRF